VKTCLNCGKKKDDVKRFATGVFLCDKCNRDIFKKLKEGKEKDVQE
jgi:ribosomal protein L37AE/L43A